MKSALEKRPTSVHPIFLGVRVPTFWQQAKSAFFFLSFFSKAAFLPKSHTLAPPKIYFSTITPKTYFRSPLWVFEFLVSSQDLVGREKSGFWNRFNPSQICPQISFFYNLNIFSPQQPQIRECQNLQNKQKQKPKTTTTGLTWDKLYPRRHPGLWKKMSNFTI